MEFSERLDRIPPYLFAEVDRKISEKRSQGVDVISFGVGDPDVPTPNGIVEALCAGARVPENHRYPSYRGLASFRRAASDWLSERFGVSMDPEDEVLSLMGSKEAIAHLAPALLDPGKVALVPEPSYPVYAMGTLLAGAEVRYLPLLPGNSFLPDLDSIPAGVLEKARVLWINYPNNPTGATAPGEFFERAVSLCRRHGIVLAHDNAYSEITYDGYTAPSLFEFEGAMDVGIEFHSLSKTFNMAGWRVGFACGNREVIGALGTVKTNIDSGVFNPIQYAAVEALANGRTEARRMAELYASRRDLLVSLLDSIGWTVAPPRGSIYIWLPVPDGFDSVGFSTYVLEEAGIFFTPGNAYGPSGEGFVRLSLTVPDDRIREAVTRLEDVFKVG